MPPLDWLTARPIAHRGLHDASAGVIENTASAFTAAIDNAYGIECDLQISADGEAMVHHDEALGRLTDGRGKLTGLSAADLKAVPFKATADRMLTLGDLCELVAGRAVLLLELKSHFNGDWRLADRTAKVLENYAGHAATMSFDPGVVERLRAVAPRLMRGIVTERRFDHPEWMSLPAAQRRSMANLSHAFRTRPHFIAYGVKYLPAAAPLVARYLFGLPILTWTVRSEDDRACAGRWSDQIIFEGWRP